MSEPTFNCGDFFPGGGPFNFPDYIGGGNVGGPNGENPGIPPGGPNDPPVGPPGGAPYAAFNMVPARFNRTVVRHDVTQCFYGLALFPFCVVVFGKGFIPFCN